MRKLLSLISITLILSVLMASVVFADDTSETETPQERQVVGIGTTVIKAPDAKLVYTDPWKGSYVWFGKYDGTPVKYRVLAPQTNIYGGNTMFLDCNSVLYRAPFNASETPNEGAQYPNEWKYSDVKAGLNGNEFLNKENGFTDAEKNSIASSSCAGYSYTINYYKTANQDEVCTDYYVPLSGEKIFLLDKNDLVNESYGFVGTRYGRLIEKDCKCLLGETSVSHGWWLRSTPLYYETSTHYASGRSRKLADVAGFNHRDYLVTSVDDYGNYIRIGVSPAFNIDLSKVVYTSLVSGTAGQNDAEYKLTLVDDAISVQIPSGETAEAYDNYVSIPYSITGTDISNVSQLSLLILDREYAAGNTTNANIKYYGQLDSFEASSSKEDRIVTLSDVLVTEGRCLFTLPSNLSISGWGSSYYVYLFAEDINDTYETDYASYPLLIDKPVDATKPIIVEHPLDTWVTAGDTVSFAVEVVGQQSFSYQWQSREVSSSEWVNLNESNAKTPTLSFETTLDDLGRQFRCVVIGANGLVTYSRPGTLLFFPTIIKQPIDAYQANMLNRAKFYLEAIGVHLHYKWQWSASGDLDSTWKDLSDDEILTLGIDSWPGRYYRCIVSDDFGHEVYSDVAKATDYLHILTQPEDISACVGETIELSAEADGRGNVLYKWEQRKASSDNWETAETVNSTKNETLGGMKTCIGILVSEDIHGCQYRCKVERYADRNYGVPHTEVYSDIVTLTVIPKISQQPTDTYAVAGSTATFTVSASGKEPISYQWQSRKNSTSDWVNSGQSGAKTSTLSVATSAGLNGWQFRCVVTDGKGATAYSEPATLYISPLISSQPKSVTVEAGSTAKFTVKATGKETLTYQWQSRKDSTSSWSNSGSTGSKTAALSVSASGGLSGWQFRCVVTDAYGKSTYSNAATLTVVPKITAQPVNTSVTAGSTATFKVAVIGKATLTYQWQSRKDSSSTWSNSGQSGSRTDTLSVTTSAGLHGWQFRCIITDGNGNTVTSNAAVLSIIRIASQPKNAVVAAGSVAKFNVTAAGAGTLTYQWQSRKDASGTWTSSGQPGAKTAALSITASAGLNGWQFRCIIKDGNGKTIVSNTATLTVVRITAQPGNVSVIAGNTAKFTVAAAGADVFTYQWQSRKDATSDWANSGQSGAKTTTLSIATSAGLNGWQFRCVVKDGSGNTVTSNPATLSIVRITTQPKNKSVTTGTTATFTVSVGGTNAQTTYQWQSRKDASSTWANSGATGSKTASLSLTATAGLHGWQFRCIVKDGNGNQIISNVATLSIIRIVTQPKSTSVKAGTTANFSVVATGAGALSYQWQARKNDSAEWSNSGQSGAKTATLAVSTSAGLNGWQFRCIVTDSNGQKVYSNAATLAVTK